METKRDASRYKSMMEDMDLCSIAGYSAVCTSRIPFILLPDPSCTDLRQIAYIEGVNLALIDSVWNEFDSCYDPRVNHDLEKADDTENYEF